MERKDFNPENTSPIFNDGEEEDMEEVDDVDVSPNSFRKSRTRSLADTEDRLMSALLLSSILEWVPSLALILPLPLLLPKVVW